MPGQPQVAVEQQLILRVDRAALQEPARPPRVRVAEHADFYGVHLDVVKDGIQLRPQKCLRGRVDLAHALGVLGHERCDHAHAVPAGGGDGFQVGLDTGAACGVSASDG